MCGEPPKLKNGSYKGPLKAYPSSIYRYSCDKGFSPFGKFKNNLRLECLPNGDYSIQSNKLPECLAGKLVTK